MSKPAKEVHLVRQVERNRRLKFILTDGSYIPENGEVLPIDGADWIVDRVTDTKIFAEFSTASGKLKQVYP